MGGGIFREMESDICKDEGHFAFKFKISSKKEITPW